MTIGQDIKESQVKSSACLTFYCKQLQAILMSNRKTIASELRATSVKGLMTVFGCDLLIAAVFRQYLSRCNVWHTMISKWNSCNRLLAMVYLVSSSRISTYKWAIKGKLMTFWEWQWKPFENRLNIIWNIKESQIKYWACWIFCCKRSQPILRSNCKPIASKIYLQLACPDIASNLITRNVWAGL